MPPPPSPKKLIILPEYLFQVYCSSFLLILFVLLVCWWDNSIIHDKGSREIFLQCRSSAESETVEFSNALQILLSKEAAYFANTDDTGWFERTHIKLSQESKKTKESWLEEIDCYDLILWNCYTSAIVWSLACIAALYGTWHKSVKCIYVVWFNYKTRKYRRV